MSNTSWHDSEHFAQVKDPRVKRTKEHPLINIIVIAICGVICGADSWTAVEEFGKSKQAWLARFLGFEERHSFA